MINKLDSDKHIGCAIFRQTPFVHLQLVGSVGEIGILR